MGIHTFFYSVDQETNIVHHNSSKAQSGYPAENGLKSFSARLFWVLFFAEQKSTYITIKDKNLMVEFLPVPITPYYIQ